MPAPDPNRKLNDHRADLLTPSNPFTYPGGYYGPEMAAAFTSKLAALRQSYESNLASYAGQRKNIKAGFRQQVAGIRGQEVSSMVQAEGQAVERGVLGGSADVKNRIGIASQTAADIEAARLEKTQLLTETFQSAIQAANDYNVATADVGLQRTAAMAAATANEVASGRLDLSGKTGLESVPKNGNFGDVVLGIGNRQVGVATYVFGTANPNESFDCSGFTSWVIQTATGMTLPHSARAQMTDSRLTKVSGSGLQPGDLVFFWYPNDRGIPSGQASHVGLFIGYDGQGNPMVMDASRAGNTIMRRTMDTAHFIGARRVPWALLPRWSRDAA